MKRIVGVVGGICLLMSVVGIAKALEGVGALADRVSGASVRQLQGRTAPWAEVVVVDPGSDDRVIAVAEIEPTGLFVFSFRLDTTTFNRAQVFGIDEVGTTNRIGVSDNTGSEFILPPTIVNDEEDEGDNNLAVTGYTYPNSTVEIHITSDQGFDETETVTADSGGRWRLNRTSLPAGEYTATARATSGNLVSELSQEIYFEILAVAIPQEVVEVVRRVTQVVDVIPGGRQVREFVTKNPELVSRVAVPVATTAVVTGFVIKDIIAILLKLLLGLLHLLGWKKGRKSWGTVYDAIKKNPLPRAIVRLYSTANGNLLETDVTGNDGVFAFLVQPGTYKMNVVKAGFSFPSAWVKGSGSDGEYDRLYHGEELKLTEGSTVNVSIPLDPEKVVVGWRFYVGRILRGVWNVIGWGVLILGFVVAIWTLLRHVSLLNIGVVVFYIGLIIWGLLKYRKQKTDWSSVLDVATGKGVEGVEVNLFDLEFGRLVQRRVSNGDGRFLMVVPQGRYKLNVNSPQWLLEVSSGKRGFAGEEIVVERGSKALGLKVWVKRKTN